MSIDEAALAQLAIERMVRAEAAIRVLRPRKTRVATQAQLYKSPIEIPTAASGAFKVRHEVVNGPVPVIGMRQAFLRGVRPVYARVENLRVHELHGPSGIWMTDLPEELSQIADALKALPPAGDVLVGGLGLGVLATTLLQMPFVSSVTVVELEPDVIQLCRPKGASVVQGDIVEFLRTTDRRFDRYYLDTWQGTNESTWWTTVMPMRRVIANRCGRQRVWCWAEDIMLGQCKRSAFSQGGENWYYKALPSNPDRATVERFFRDVGLPTWEKRYGEKAGKP
jgi:hypothetical protein